MKPEPGTSVTESLKRLGTPSPAHAPVLFDVSRDEDSRRLLDLIATKAERLTHYDSLSAQVTALLEVRRASVAVTLADTGEFIARSGGERYGVWVYYPWLELLVRTLPKAEFRELRSARNRYKITAPEQERLLAKKVGIVGLSAGHSMAVCLALEGIGGTLRLADFDTIELSNTNRVPCGLPGLGTNKAVLAARRLFEIDPYLQVEVYPEGIDERTLDVFLTQDGLLDLLVEECDDLWLKVRLRERARELRIPVLMETNDRGLFDIERFDLEPERPILHGLLEGTGSRELVALDLERKTPFVLKVVGSHLSPRAAASLIEVKKSLTGWPQLGSGTALGGAVVADVARRILLQQLYRSGRYYVDLEALVGDDSRESGGSEPEQDRVSVSSPTTPVTRPAPSRSAEALDESEVRELVLRATTAPSGGNAQPWRFVWQGGELDCFLDRSRGGSFLDHRFRSSYLALGSAGEALVHAASALGRAVEIRPFPVAGEVDLVFRAEFARPSSAFAPSELSSLLEARCTNRRLGQRAPLASEHRDALREAAVSCHADLELVTEPDALRELGSVLGEVDRLRLLCARTHADVMSELRWTDEDARASGDGIDVATLELDDVGMAALKLLRNPSTSALLRELDKGERLTTAAKRALDAASAVGLLTIEGTDEGAYVRGGRAVERVWLVATKLGLAFQPMAVAPYLFARLEAEGGEAFNERERSSLAGLRRRFSGVFPTPSGRAELLLFRITRAAPPGVRSLRRPIEKVLFWD